MPKAAPAGKRKRKIAVRRVVAVKDNVIPFRRRKSPLTRPRALALLRSKDVIKVSSITALGELLGWQRQNVSDALKRWTEAKQITVTKHGKSGLTIRALPVDPVALREFGPGDNKPRKSRRRKAAASAKNADEKRTSDGADERKFDEEFAVPDVSENERKLDRKFISGTDCTSNSYAGMSASENAQNDPHDEGENFALESAPELAPEGVRSTSVSARLLPRFFGSKKAPAPLPPPPPIATHDEPVIKRGGPGGGGGGPSLDAIDTFRHANWFERFVLLIAMCLSGTAAWMSVSGMAILVPLGVTGIVVFCSLIEVMKFFGFGVMSAGWREYGRSKLVVGALLFVGALINCAGVYGWMIVNHAAPAAARSATYTKKDADAAAKVDVVQARLNDLTRRIEISDSIATEAAKRGKSKSALSAIEKQRKDRASLAGERDRTQQELSGLRTERTGLAANHGVDETAAMPVRAAMALFEDVGLIAPGTDPEKLFRWLAFGVLLAGDPTALAVMVMINSRTRRRKA